MGENEPQQVAANNENRNSPYYLDTSTVDEALIDRNKKPALFDYLKEHYENDSHYNYLIKKYENDSDYNYANVPLEELRDAQTFYHHAGDYEKDVYSKLFQKLFNNDGEKFRQFVLDRLNPDTNPKPHMDAVYLEISNNKTASIPVILQILRSNNSNVRIDNGKVTEVNVGTYDALFAGITYGNCSDYGIDPKRLYLVDQELTKDPVHSTEEHKLPAQYEGKGKLWIPFAFRPYEEYSVHHLNDKVTDLINKLPTKYPNDPQKQEDVKSALNKANNYIYNKDDKATSFYSSGTHYECLTGERATKSVRDMAEISLHSVSNIDNYEHIYAYKNDALQAKIANGEINSEQSQKAFEKVKLLNFDTSEEYKEKLIQFINKIKQYNNDFFSNKQNLRMKAGANGFSIKLRAAYREMEQAVQNEDYDHIQEKVTAYEQIRGEMQQLYKEGLELFKNGTPHVVSTNADMLRDNDLPLEYATLGDNALISKLNAVFNMAITCELLSVPVEDFVKDPVNTIFKGYENVNKSTGAASDLLADELIQENEGYWNRKKSAISRLAGAARRSLDCIATGDNAEKTGENILKWHIVAGLNDDLYQTQHDLVDGFRDVLKRPEGNPEAYTQILGANLLGTDKIRLNIPEQRNESGLTPVGRTELPDISEYKENINTERFNKLLNDVNMLIRNNPNSTPRNAVGYVSAAYKILKNRDMKKEQNLKLLTKVKDMESRLKMTDNFSKRLLKAGKAEFEIGQEVLKNEDIKAAEQISKESITDLPASLDKVGSVFGKGFYTSNQFREANNAISDLAAFAGQMKLVKKPDDEMLKTYKEKMLKAIDKCTAYLDKKNKEMYDSRHSRSDYEKKRVLAVSRICERLKKEYALNKTKTIMLNRTEFALEALKNPEIDKPEYKDVKYKMAAWATVGREFRRKDYKMSRPNDSVNTMLNSAGFKRIVDTHTGAELFNIIKNYEMSTLLMNQINNPSASGNQKNEGKEIKNTQPGNTNELKQAKGKEIAPKV